MLRVTKIQKMAQESLHILQIYKNKSPCYLYNLIPDIVKFYSARSSQIDIISNIKNRSSYVINSFFRPQ